MKIVDGNIACANVAYLFSDICPIYPITPSSPMASEIDKLSSKNKLNLFGEKVRLVEMQSEAGAVATMHGALLAGNLATTFTSSQGLLLMLPNMYKIAGECLPGVIHVASRTVATHALSIFGDHSDIYAARNTGFCMLASTSVQDAQNLAAIAHLSAIKGRLPFLHFFDGFRTSHELNTINEIGESELKKLIPEKELKEFLRSGLLNQTCQKGMAENEDIFFQVSEARNQLYLDIPDIVNDYMQKINKLTNNNYAPFTYYGNENAENIIIAMGSVCDTIKKVVDDLNEKKEKVGVISVHLYRPFSAKFLNNVLPKSVKRIAVLDRAKDANLGGEPLYLDVLNALKDQDIKIVGGRYGISSKNTTPDQIKSVFEMLNGTLRNNWTIGIDDDVTNLSLPTTNYELPSTCNEMVIYGYGGDGMVSASKELMHILGEKENYFVQGYFEYDSKKSSGWTKSHLRYGKTPIRMPYYVTHPSLVVVTEEKYLKRIDLLKGIKEESVLIINTNKTVDEISQFMSNKMIEVINEKKIKVYLINATKIAKENKLGNKISKIMEIVILKFLNVKDFENILKENIRNQFKTKGEEVVNNNINALKGALDNLVLVEKTLDKNENDLVSDDLVAIINNREGNSLKVSEVLNLCNGSFPCGTSSLEKRSVSEEVPKWIKEKCVQCTMCSFVCPHAVIRPFILDKAHEYYEKGKTLMTKEEYNFLISVSELDCTSCGLCINVCPTNALEFGKVDPLKQDIANKLFNEYENPKLFSSETIKGSQFNKPKFEFSGACAGCGETPYIKLLTQLFGDKLLIANATGCSSIYGGSVPNAPYSVPWANSLFEDNAEFGFGLLNAYNQRKEKVQKIILANLNNVSDNVKALLQNWLDNSNDYEITKEIQETLAKEKLPLELKEVLSDLKARSVWTIGGDGWAYDIGFGGIDQVLSSGENVNILVLDTEVYSNTGGQASKGSHLGQVCEFANLGKRTIKKDLFKIAMAYPDVYVASISLGANPMQTIKAFKEAEDHDGPSIIIAYSPCVEQGIKPNMSEMIEEQKKAVECGYLLLMRYHDKLTLDSMEPNFAKYEEFLNNEVRYNALKIKDEKLYQELINEQINHAKKRYEYYLNLSK